MLEKIWRAVRCSESFTVKDLKILTGATEDYIGRYITYLAKEEYIRQTGKKKQTPVYRVTEKATPETPQYKRIVTKPPKPKPSRMHLSVMWAGETLKTIKTDVSIGCVVRREGKWYACLNGQYKKAPEYAYSTAREAKSAFIKELGAV